MKLIRTCNIAFEASTSEDYTGIIAPAVIDDTNPAVKYFGNWSIQEGSAYYLNSGHYVNPGESSYCEVEFKGNGFKLSAPVGAPYQGEHYLYINGVQVLPNPNQLNVLETSDNGHVWYISPNLGYGIHTFTFESIPEYGNYPVIDKIEIF